MTESRSPRIRSETVLLAFGIGILLWLVGDVLLMVFAGVLLAIALSALAEGLAYWVPVRRGLCLFIVALLLGTGLVVLGFMVVPQAIEELGTLVQRLMEIAGSVQLWVQDQPVFAGDGDGNFRDDGGDGAIGTVQDAAGAAAGVVIGVLGAAGTTVVVIVIGIFMAADPRLYIIGFLKLFPQEARPRASEALSLISYVLRWWLLGQLVSMAVLGTLTALGLFLVEIDLWLGLAAMTAIMTFVPFLGPIVAGIAVVSIAFAVDIETGIIVFVFFLALQNLEGYILTPMIQKRAALMPPALLITMQVLFGTLFGAPGLILAAPLTAAVLVGVNLLYVEDVLGDGRAVPEKGADAEVEPVRPPVNAHPAMRIGSQSVIAGKARSSPRRTMSAAKKGRMPRMIVACRSPGATPWMTKRFMPTGGVISPISATVTSRMPNQIGSKSSARITGKTNGTVSRIMESASMKQPSTHVEEHDDQEHREGREPRSWMLPTSRRGRPETSMK